MSTDELQDYMDFDEVVLLASIETPRRITDQADLRDFRILASQDMISFGSTMEKGEGDEFFTIPTAKLTEGGEVVLAFMRSKMDESSAELLREKVKAKDASVETALATI